MPIRRPTFHSTTLGPIYMYAHERDDELCCFSGARLRPWQWLCRSRYTVWAQLQSSLYRGQVNSVTQDVIYCWILSGYRCALSLILALLWTQHITNGDHWHVTDTYDLIRLTCLTHKCRSKAYSWVTTSTLIFNNVFSFCRNLQFSVNVTLNLREHHQHTTVGKLEW
jgi:hypothetical protein